jgi:predicted enzyme related to lactoylglutathione lyase
MFFRKNKPGEVAAMEAPCEKPLLVWIEIGVSDVDKCAPFYEEVFEVRINIRNIFGKKVGLFERKNADPGICLIEDGSAKEKNSVKPVFIVNVMHLAIEKACASGGSMVSPPSLLHQLNQKGETLIGSNLIDEQTGYIAEISDPEGNHLFIYSHH